MKLILLNGPSGVGKSTIAERLHKELPLSLLIEIDAWRRFISGFREHRKVSLQLAQDYGLAAMRIHFKAGYDVIVDKAILDADEFIDEMRSLANTCDAEIHEFILIADKAIVLQRAEQRGYRPGGLLTPQVAAERWEVGKQLSERRTEATVIDTTHLNAEEAYERVSSQVLGD